MSTLPKRAVRNVLFRIFTKNVTLEFLLYKKDKHQIFAFCENPNKMFKKIAVLVYTVGCSDFEK